MDSNSNQEHIKQIPKNFSQIETGYQSTTDPTIPIFVDYDQFVDSYMSWSILNNMACLFTGVFVLFFSIPALIFSMRTRDYLKLGNIQEARMNSKYARSFNIAATTVLITVFLVTTFLLIISLNFQPK